MYKSNTYNTRTVNYTVPSQPVNFTATPVNGGILLTFTDLSFNGTDLTQTSTVPHEKVERIIISVDDITNIYNIDAPIVIIRTDLTYSAAKGWYQYTINQSSWPTITYGNICELAITYQNNAGVSNVSNSIQSYALPLAEQQDKVKAIETIALTTAGVDASSVTIMWNYPTWDVSTNFDQFKDNKLDNIKFKIKRALVDGSGLTDIVTRTDTSFKSSILFNSNNYSFNYVDTTCTVGNTYRYWVYTLINDEAYNLNSSAKYSFSDVYCCSLANGPTISGVPGDNTLTINVVSVDASNGLPYTTTYFYDISGTGLHTLNNQVALDSSHNFLINGLTNGTEYTVVVRAQTSDNLNTLTFESLNSTSVSYTPYDVPDTPNNLQVLPVDASGVPLSTIGETGNISAKLNITWDNMPFLNGIQTKYLLYRSEVYKNTDLSATLMYDGSLNSFSDTSGVQISTEYQYKYYVQSYVVIFYNGVYHTLFSTSSDYSSITSPFAYPPKTMQTGSGGRATRGLDGSGYDWLRLNWVWDAGYGNGLPFDTSATLIVIDSSSNAVITGYTLANGSISTPITSLTSLSNPTTVNNKNGQIFYVDTNTYIINLTNYVGQDTDSSGSGKVFDIKMKFTTSYINPYTQVKYIYHPFNDPDFYYEVPYQNINTLPAAPSTLTITNIDASGHGLNGQLNLSWLAVTPDSDWVLNYFDWTKLHYSNPVKYIVQRSTDNANFTTIATITDISYNNTGLTNGTTYYYKIQTQINLLVAGNITSLSSSTNQAKPFTTNTAPTSNLKASGSPQAAIAHSATQTIPSGAILLDPSNGAVIFDISTSVISAGISIVNGLTYTGRIKVTYSKLGVLQSAVFLSNNGQITGLTNGTNYTFNIQTEETDGYTLSYSNSISQSATPYIAPGTVTGLTVTPLDATNSPNGKLYINWIPVVYSTGPSAIVHYQVTDDTSGNTLIYDGSNNQFTYTNPTTPFPTSIKVLAYVYNTEVQANIFGSNCAAVTTNPFVVPGPVQTIEFKCDGSSNLVLQFTDVANPNGYYNINSSNPGSLRVYYEIQLFASDSSSNPISSSLNSDVSSNSPIVFSNSTYNFSLGYTYRVYVTPYVKYNSINYIGTNNYASSIPYNQPTIAGRLVTGLTIAALSTALSLYASWSQYPDISNGITLQNYAVTLFVMNGGQLYDMISTSTLNTTFNTLTDMTLSYYVTVYFTYKIGNNGNLSNTIYDSSSINSSNVYCIPENVTNFSGSANSGDNKKIDLSWSLTSNMTLNFLSMYNFHIYRTDVLNPVSIIYTGTDTRCIDTNSIEPNIDYTYTIYVVGNGSPVASSYKSNGVQTTIESNNDLAITDLSGVYYETNIKLSWTIPDTTDTTATITNYTIRKDTILIYNTIAPTANTFTDSTMYDGLNHTYTVVTNYSDKSVMYSNQITVLAPTTKSIINSINSTDNTSFNINISGLWTDFIAVGIPVSGQVQVLQDTLMKDYDSTNVSYNNGSNTYTFNYTFSVPLTDLLFIINNSTGGGMYSYVWSSSSGSSSFGSN